MRIVLFDIDGTLTRGDGLGTRCFFSTFAAAFRFRPFSERLSAFRESTDSGIAGEVFERAWGRPPEVEELGRFHDAYVDSLKSEVARRPDAYRPIAGAPEALAGGLAEAGWTVALATGNWRAAAAVKLASAGLADPGRGGFADDARTRAGVLEAALASVAATADAEAVYVGDRPWDLAAATALGVGFVGVGCGPSATALREAGARTVVEDFADGARLCEALEREAVPRRPRSS